jgi:hypothetical protein
MRLTNGRNVDHPVRIGMNGRYLTNNVLSYGPIAGPFDNRLALRGRWLSRTVLEIDWQSISDNETVTLEIRLDKKDMKAVTRYKAEPGYNEEYPLTIVHE